MTPPPLPAASRAHAARASDPDEAREALHAIFAAGVAAASPAQALPPHLPPAPAGGRVIVLAAGKAAASMAQAAEAHYAAARIEGVAVARHGYGAPLARVRLIEAGHPVPDAHGLAGAEDALRLAAGAGPDDLVLALISGGGSANWIAPAAGLTLADKQAITRACLRAGAAIGEINTLRKRLSRIKGGRLARAAANAGRIVTLAISDVPGDDPAVIASGPTVPDPTTNADARAVVARHRLELPEAARRLLDDPANETPKPGDPAFQRSEFRIVAKPADALEAAARAARAAGHEPVLLGADVEGEAREVAAAHAKLAREARAAGRRVAILSGGELTVTLRGHGRGGPNQEYALALAVALDGADGICALAGDTDGTDGGGGDATDPAGALVDPTTLERARAKGLEARAHLDNNDSTAFFAALGDLLTPGPTLTNVNDLRVILVEPA